MTVDRPYCMSSFLEFRFIEDEGKTFSARLTPRHYHIPQNRVPVVSAATLEAALRGQLEGLDFGRTALMLSGGVDSAILARMVPPGTKAYTLKCVAPNARDEIEAARRYADACGLAAEVIEVGWEDYLAHTPALMRHMGQPVHSIEPQLYKAALHAKKNGYDTLVFGESADIIYGGHSIQLARDMTVDEFIASHDYVDPVKAVRGGYTIREPYERYAQNGIVDVYAFLNDIHLRQSPNSYINACSLAGVTFCAPYAQTYLARPIDLGRIRGGDSKYIVGELFRRLYPGWARPEKLPLPRALDIWLRGYPGPKRPEFFEMDPATLSPDQRWYLYALELFLDLVDSLEAV